MDKAKFKRVVIALIAIFLIVNVVYVFINSVFDVDGVETEIATEMTATDTLYKDAIIIRDEELIKNDTARTSSPLIKSHHILHIYFSPLNR